MCNELKIYVITTGNQTRLNFINKYLSNIDFQYVYSDNIDELNKLEKQYNKSSPKLCEIYGFVSHIRLAKRRNKLPSIANKKKGKKTFNPINMNFWVINKIKYRY